jgi:uncharacterized protein
MRDWRDNLIDDDEGLRLILQEARSVAVLGAKSHRAEPAWYVPAYLAVRGYRILPVNPRFAGAVIHGAKVVRSLAELSERVDIVEVFRQPRFLPGHAEEILALAQLPAVVWFQLGIRSAEAAERLARAGVRVVQDRCMMPEHRRLIGG